jgi:thiol-disulfide isomerase/thioredoxin
MGLLKKLILFFIPFLFLSCGQSKPPVTGWNDHGPDSNSFFPLAGNPDDSGKVIIEGGFFSNDPAGHIFHRTAHYQATVFFFLSPDCPLCRSYMPRLRELTGKFASDSIKFFGIFPGTSYSHKEIGDFFKACACKMDTFVDEGRTLTAHLGATVTPEVFVVDRKGKTLYSGRIDNWAYEVGKKRTVVTEHELEDALNAIVRGQPIKVKHADAVGCFIEKEKNK